MEGFLNGIPVFSGYQDRAVPLTRNQQGFMRRRSLVDEPMQVVAGVVG